MKVSLVTLSTNDITYLYLPWEMQSPKPMSMWTTSKKDVGQGNGVWFLQVVLILATSPISIGGSPVLTISMVGWPVDKRVVQYLIFPKPKYQCRSCNVN